MTPKAGSRWSVSRLLHHRATAWVILLASFVLTATAWHLSDSYVRQRAADRFEFQVTDVTERIAERMLEYQTALRAGLGLFEASDTVTREDWHAFVRAVQVGKYFPGIQGFGFSELVPPAQRAQHEAHIRAQGFPDYTIRPPGQRALYTTIIYLEPFNARNQRAFGFDMFSEPTRRTAMERARDTGQAALSGRVTLVQETDTDVQHGVLMYVPVYRRGVPHGTPEQRENALQGFVYAPFRMRDLMQGILAADQGDIEFELYDGDTQAADKLLHQSHSGALFASRAGLVPEFSALRKIEVAGRDWTLSVVARPGFLSLAEESQPLVVAVGGLLVDVLLFATIGSIARQQKRAEELAQAMTLDLRRSNADLEQFAYAASHDMRQPLRMVSSYLQLLEAELQPVLTDEMRHNLHYAIDGAQRMDQMLSALLEYARVGRETDHFAWQSSHALLDEALRYLQPEISAAQAQIRIEGDWPQLFARRDDLVRVLQNLVGNALKYRLPERCPDVVLRAHSSGEAHHFSVQDNGIGLLPGQSERLFKVFERLQARSQYPGTGIGLALCRKIVELHGGHIAVASAGENLGCTFSFSLPRRDPTQDPPHDRS
ncbi:MAG: CHASE domain-containing protein [Rhodoferax sp.]|nr:CHASE domain-containing protein [Rhodoferax sp.]